MAPSLDPSDHLPQAPLRSNEQVSPRADQPAGVDQIGVDGSRYREVIDGQWIELTGAESLDAVGRAFAGLAKARANKSEIRQAERSTGKA